MNAVLPFAKRHPLAALFILAWLIRALLARLFPVLVYLGSGDW
jgi:hypothetical protein